MYRAHCCEQYRAHHRKPDSTVLKQIAARLVEQFRGDVPADLDLTIAEARARQWEEARRMAARRETRNWSVAVSYAEPDEQMFCSTGRSPMSGWMRSAVAARVWARWWPSSFDAVMTPICARPAISGCERRMSADLSASSVPMTRRLRPIANSVYCNPGGCHASPCRGPSAANGARRCGTVATAGCAIGPRQR